MEANPVRFSRIEEPAFGAQNALLSAGT